MERKERESFQKASRSRNSYYAYRRIREEEERKAPASFQKQEILLRVERSREELFLRVEENET